MKTCFAEIVYPRVYFRVLDKKRLNLDGTESRNPKFYNLLNDLAMVIGGILFFKQYLPDL